MRTITLIIAVLAGLYAAPATAIEPLSGTTLKRYCKNYVSSPRSVLCQKCVAYVGGFLDGALVTDARVAKNIVDEIEKDETYSERAIRTRVYGRLRDQGPSAYAEFCIGNPVPLKEVVAHVVEELKTRKTLKDIAAQSIVYASVRKHYPCK